MSRKPVFLSLRRSYAPVFPSLRRSWLACLLDIAQIETANGQARLTLPELQIAARETEQILRHGLVRSMTRYCEPPFHSWTDEGLVIRGFGPLGRKNSKTSPGLGTRASGQLDYSPRRCRRGLSESMAKLRPTRGERDVTLKCRAT